MESEPQRAGRVRKAVRQKLESLQRAGVAQASKRVKAAPPATSPPPSPATAASPVTTKPPSKAGTKSADRVAALAVIQDEVRQCTRCSILVDNRTQTVFGVGNPQARLVFCGEAPGADEDEQGEPFVGRAGQLLNKIIEACTLKREDVYILNTLKCRPPNNRPPAPDELSNCRGFLERQLAIIKPEFICCLGTHAAQAVLQTDVTIGKLRGQFHQAFDATVICTYHPAYLLRNPDAKRFVWDDMKKLMKEMGVEL